MALKLPIGTTRTVSKTFTQDDVLEFASLSGDYNRLHIDYDYAAHTRFEEPIMHGALTSSLISAALAALPGCVIFLEQNVRFNRAAVVGTELTAEVVISDVLDGGVHAVDVTVVDDEGENYVSGVCRVLVDSMDHYADALLSEGVEGHVPDSSGDSDEVSA